MPNGNQFGGYGQPGPWVREPPAQVEERRVEGAATSLRLPLWQAVALSFCVSIVCCLVPLVIVAIGKATFWLAAVCFGIASLIWLHRIAARYHDLNITDSIAAVGVVCVMGGVAYACQRVLGMLSFHWSLLIIPAFLFFCSMSICLTVAFGQELIQRSPFQEQALWGAIGEIITHRFKQAPARRVVQPVPVHERGQVRILALPHEPAEGELCVESPAGQQIPASDLRMFVEAGPVTGASFRTWSEREGWSHDYWGEVVGTLAHIGIMKPREPRKATEFAVTDPAEAAAMLEEFLEGA